MTVADGIRNFAEVNPQYQLYENYSGRGMFGKTCLGVIVHYGESFMNFLMELTKYFEEQGIEDVDCELEGVSYDDLGLDTVVYFPSVRR